MAIRQTMMQIEDDRTLVRDMESKALLPTDRKPLDSYNNERERRKNAADKINRLESDMLILENKLAERNRFLEERMAILESKLAKGA